MTLIQQFSRAARWLGFGAIGVVVALAACFTWLEHSMATAGPLQAPLVMVVEPGRSVQGVVNQLERESAIHNALVVRLWARWNNLGSRLQAGEYRFAVAASAQQILTQLTTGDVLLHPVRIKEGVTVAELLATLKQEVILRQEIRATTGAALKQELALEVAFAEGYFLPETYYVRRNDSDRSVLERANRSMQEQLAKAWSSRAPGTTLASQADLLILASIIEKESSLETDRFQISQVFHSRLAVNMRLQTDPTVIYALGTEFDGDLRRRDLRVDSPYNTYRRRGLPPTPIALPSLSSLQAAAHPAEGDFLYFVAKGDGTSAFSRTLAEHNRAVRRYQLKREQP